MERTYMESNRIGNQLNGRAIGSMICAGFGALWLTLGAAARQVLTVDVVIGIATVFAVLAAGAFWVLQQSKRYPRMQEDPAMGHTFGWVNALQWIIGGIVAFTLSRFHLDVYIPAAISAIVGIHFFPLAKLFRYPMHNVTGAALVIWASVSVLAAPLDHLQSTSAFGTGLILWISCAVSITLAARVAMRTEATPAHARMSL